MVDYSSSVKSVPQSAAGILPADPSKTWGFSSVELNRHLAAARSAILRQALT
jgi:hypothetical protein